MCNGRRFRRAFALTVSSRFIRASQVDGPGFVMLSRYE
jgi:hypothetical protein